MHAQFMQATAARNGAAALRTDHGFVLSYPHEGRCFVDDFAVDDDTLWASEGRELLLGVWDAARSDEQPVLRAVTARADEPKRSMLVDSGLAVGARWWVKELVPSAEASTWGPIKLADVEGLVMPAPPVYDPGGPVCLFGAVSSPQAVVAAESAAGVGAVLAIVQRDGGPNGPPESEPDLEAAGFHNPSEFYDGMPV